MQWINNISPARIAKWFLLLFCLLFIPYFILCLFAHPVADDFTYGPESPFWRTQLELYRHWNGRYSANFVIMSNPILFDSLFGYRLFAAILIVLIPISILFVLNTLVGKAIPTSQKILGALILIFIILALLPSLPEGIYWYPGAGTYILGAVFAMFYIGSIIRFYNKTYFINKIIHGLICVMLLLIAVGFNEVQMFIMILFHLLIWTQLKKEMRFNSFWFLLLVCCILFSSVMFFASGNYYRGEYFPTNHKFFHSLFMTILQMLRFFFSWISFAPLWIASILFAPLSFKINQQPGVLKRVGDCNPWVMFSLVWIILFLCIFPPYWSTGILGQHRTLNTACFYFVLLWFLFLHTLFTRNNLSDKIESILTLPIQLTLVIMLALSLLFSGNEGTALMELTTGKISAFDSEMNNRYKQMKDAKEHGIKDISMTPLQNKPASLFVLDIQPGCTHWINQQQAHFFGLEKICGDSTSRFENVK